jgi:methionyl-tRNA synthetase
MISFDDFSKLDLRIAKIIAAERIDGSDKLLRIELTLDGEYRQIVAGIGIVYEPEQLIGKEVVVVANLEPKIIKGIESQGMLLAASTESGPVLIIPEREVPPGTKVY